MEFDGFVLVTQWFMIGFTGFGPGVSGAILRAEDSTVDFRLLHELIQVLAGWGFPILRGVLIACYLLNTVLSGLHKATALLKT